jgi:TetR/AcrR family transcriptional regulator
MRKAQRKEKQQADHRLEIMEAALRIFSEKGYEATTMDAVSLASDFTKRTVYLYFHSKDRLYTAIVVKAMTLLIGMVEEAFEGGKTGLEKLGSMGYAYVRFRKEHPLEFTILCYKRRGAGPAGGEYTRGVRDENARMLRVIARTFTQGISDGSIRGDVDPIRSALYLISVSSGILEVISEGSTMMGGELGIEPEEFVEYAMKMIGRSFRSQ